MTMPTFEDAARIALSLPSTEATEGGTQFRVAGAMFAWIYPERLAGSTTRVPNRNVLVVSVPDLQTKEALLQAEPEVLFTTDHYDGYKAVLVRLTVADEPRLTELIVEAWRARAPKSLLRQFDA